MSTGLWLDPDITDDLAPFDWDESKRQGTGISPFGIPRAIDVHMTGDNKVAQLEFRYTNKEAGGRSLALVPDDGQAVHLEISSVSFRISEIHLDPPVDRAGLLKVAERLEAGAKSIKPLAVSFSFRMIAVVLQRFAERIFATGD